MTVHNIVIVGGGFAGIGVAHYLLRHTIPVLESQNQSITYKVTLLSASSQFFWNIASPRVLASPDLIPLKKVLIPIENGFGTYSPSKFSLVLGSVTALDEGQRLLTIEPLAPHSTTSVTYDSLVIATGTRSTSALWHQHGSHEKTVAEFEKLHESLPKASSILIAGGGPTGTETAGKMT